MTELTKNLDIFYKRDGKMKAKTFDRLFNLPGNSQLCLSSLSNKSSNKKSAILIRKSLPKNCYFVMKPSLFVVCCPYHVK